MPLWSNNKKEKEASPQPFVAIESLESSRPEGREGRLFDLVILSLFLHSAGSTGEMMSAFLEKGPRVTESMFVYPMILDKKRDTLSSAYGNASLICSSMLLASGSSVKNSS